VDVLCDAGYATAVLDIWVRQRQALTLEQAVHKLTAVPAALFGIPQRGTLIEGQVADLVLFDPTTVAPHPPEYVQDFPRAGRRLISRATGVVATFVAGTQVYGFCRKVRFLGQNPKIGYQKFNDLQTAKISKKQLCDRTLRPATNC